MFNETKPSLTLLFTVRKLKIQNVKWLVQGHVMIFIWSHYPLTMLLYTW